MEIDEDKWTNLRGTGFHEDVESIIVKPGCVVFGYDENSKTASKRGTGISVSAVGKTDWVYRELDSEEFVSYTNLHLSQASINQLMNNTHL